MSAFRGNIMASVELVQYDTVTAFCVNCDEIN